MAVGMSLALLLAVKGSMELGKHLAHQVSHSHDVASIDMNEASSTKEDTISQKAKQQEAFLAVQEKRLKLYMEDNTKSNHSVDITGSEILKDNTYVLHGYLNNDDKLSFSAKFSKDGFNEGVKTDQATLKLMKPHPESVDTIIKKKQLNQQDYEVKK